MSVTLPRIVDVKFNALSDSSDPHLVTVWTADGEVMEYPISDFGLVATLFSWRQPFPDLPNATTCKFAYFERSSINSRIDWSFYAKIAKITFTPSGLYPAILVDKVATNHRVILSDAEAKSAMAVLPVEIRECTDTLVKL